MPARTNNAKKPSTTPYTMTGVVGAMTRRRAAHTRAAVSSGTRRRCGKPGRPRIYPDFCPSTLNKRNGQNSSEINVVTQRVRGDQSTRPILNSPQKRRKRHAFLSTQLITEHAKRCYKKRRLQASMKTRNIRREPLKVVLFCKSRPNFTATRDEDDNDDSQILAQEGMINNDVTEEVTKEVSEEVSEEVTEDSSRNVIDSSDSITPSAGPNVNSTQATEPLIAEVYPTILRVRPISELLIEPSQTCAPSEDQGAGPSTAANYAPISLREEEHDEVVQEGCDHQMNDYATTVLVNTTGEEVDEDDDITEIASPPRLSDFEDVLSENMLQEPLIEKENITTQIVLKKTYSKSTKAIKKNKKRSENEEKIQQLETELTKVQIDLLTHKIAEDEVNNLQEENKHIKRELEHAKKAKDEFKKEINAIKEELQAQKEENKKLEQKMVTTDAENINLIKKLEQEKNTIIDSLQNRLQNIQKENNKNMNDLSVLSLKLKCAEDKTQRLQRELNQYTSNITRVENENKILLEQINEKERLLEAEVKKVKALERQGEENTTFTNFNSALAAKDAVIEQQKQELKRLYNNNKKYEIYFKFAKFENQCLKKKLKKSKDAKENQNKVFYNMVQNYMTVQQNETPGNGKEPDGAQKLLNKDPEEDPLDVMSSSEEDSDEPSTSSQPLPNEDPSLQNLQCSLCPPGAEMFATTQELADHKASQHRNRGKRSKGDHTDQNANKIN